MQTGNIVEIRGDGEFVSIEVETEFGESISIQQDKLSVKNDLIKKLQDAVRVPEKGCNDPFDHWEGHCGCK